MFPVVRRTVIIGILFFAFVCFWPAVNKDHAGPTRIIDANTLEVKGERHRLYGLMDADQACRKWNREPKACAEQTDAALAAFLHGRPTYCQVRQKIGRDDAKRFISICYVEHDNIAIWMVDNGWAMADPSADRLNNYVSNQSMARFVRKGFWKDILLSNKRYPQ